MANRYQYSTPYSGARVAALPPGYMAAATEPGRNLAAGIASFGKDMGDAIKRHSDDAKATKSMRSLIGIYKPELKDEAETWSKSELEGKIKGFVMQQDEAERASIQSLRGAQTDQMQAAQSEIERQAKAVAMFNQSVAGQQPDPVASVAGAMADPRSGVTLSSLSRFAGQNPVTPKLTPEGVMRLAAMSGALTPEMATRMTQLDNPLARMRAEADAIQAAAYAKQVDTAATARAKDSPEVKTVGGRDYYHDGTNWKPLSEQPFATMRIDDPETGGQITVPISQEEYERRMGFVPMPQFKGGKAEESAWLEARDAIAKRPDLRDAILKRMESRKFTTEGL